MQPYLLCFKCFNNSVSSLNSLLIFLFSVSISLSYACCEKINAHICSTSLYDTNSVYILYPSSNSFQIILSLCNKLLAKLIFSGTRESHNNLVPYLMQFAYMTLSPTNISEGAFANSLLNFCIR